MLILLAAAAKESKEKNRNEREITGDKPEISAGNSGPALNDQPTITNIRLVRNVMRKVRLSPEELARANHSSQRNALVVMALMGAGKPLWERSWKCRILPMENGRRPTATQSNS
jgi:hypothetical protein